MHFRAIIRTFMYRQDGALTAFGLFLIIAMICVGGLAIDVANAIMVRTHLQVAADSAAHAALITVNERDDHSEVAARAAAKQVAQNSLPTATFGDTIRDSDIQFGQYNSTTGVFTPVAGSLDAVWVNTQRLQSRGNGMATYFLKFLGLYNMDVVSASVFETYRPTCMREGFVAEQRVDVQSNNIYRAGFCLHSNSHIEMNSNNILENGVIISMPSKADLVIPASGMTSNVGLSSALRSGAYRIRVLGRIDDIIAGFDDSTSDYYSSLYFNTPIQTVNLNPNQQLDASGWTAGAIHTASCNGNKKLRIKSNATIRNGVIHTACDIVIGSNATLEDVLIVSESTDLRAIDGGSGVTLGLDDGCTSGGGVQIVTKGGVRFTANLHMFGVQILAMDDIDFEANGNGVEGVSMVTMGEIDSTSNMDMGFCGGAGMDNNFEAEYFRLAR